MLSCRVCRTNAPYDLGSMLSLDRRNVVLALQIKPELCAVPEATESHGCVGGNGAATIEDVGDTAGRHPEIEGEPVCTEAARLQLALQEAARMCCERHGMVRTSFHVV